MQGKVTR